MSRVEKGFTLIEILVAMAIFSLIGVAATAILTTVIDSDSLSQARAGRLQQLQRAMLFIERDLLQAMPRATRVNGERVSIVMRGGPGDSSDADAIGFVRGGWQNPQLMLPRSTQQYVAYRLYDGQLQRVYSMHVDNVVGYEPKTQTLLENITDFQVSFIAPSGTFDVNDPDWQQRYQDTQLPRMVALEITSDDFGVIRREFALATRPPQ